MGLADNKNATHKSILSVALQNLKKLKVYANCVYLSCRSTKDLLESSLFQAQQQVSQLEVTKGQLEMKVEAISQAKEATQGAVFAEISNLYKKVICV